MPINGLQINGFLDAMGEYYAAHGRHNLPWRLPEPDATFDAYKIMVSEIMLQQTQAVRVIPKYEEFIATFPNVGKLAQADLSEVLKLWQGLGYNRRAKYLWLAAQQINNKGWPDDLTKLPGIGANTAGALRAYAFNEPVVFIETNIRTVLIHHFGGRDQDISDTWLKNILDEIMTETSLRGKGFYDARTFYWAMMDYGVHLKATEGNASRRSKHYKKQSAFIGSNREVRGKVIRELLLGAKSRASLGEIIKDNRLDTVLNTLEQEGLVTQSGDVYRIPNR